MPGGIQGGRMERGKVSIVPRVLALAGVWFTVFYAVAGKGIGGDAQRLHGLQHGNPPSTGRHGATDPCYRFITLLAR
jgi:hypothetical protein